MIKKISTLLILLGIILLNTTCGKQYLYKYVTYEGYVYDSIGGKPVKGIEVVLNAALPGFGSDKTCYVGDNGQFGVGISSTDASGHFYIHEKAARTDAYFPKCFAAPNFGSPECVHEAQLSSPIWTNIFLK